MKKGERLENMIIRSKYKNVSQFSKAAGVPYTTIKSFIERDLEKASIDSVVKIAKVLNVSVEYLIGEDTEERESPSTQYTYLPTSISAGLPLNVDGVTDAEKISIPDAVMGKYAGNKDIIISKINGDSMDKLMNDGSFIAIKPIDSADSLNNGDIVVFSHNHEYSVKCFYKHDDTLVFKPYSNNPVHYDQSFSVHDGVVIHGKVVTYIVNLD